MTYLKSNNHKKDAIEEDEESSEHEEPKEMYDNTSR